GNYPSGHAPASADIYTISLHDALPIYFSSVSCSQLAGRRLRKIEASGNRSSMPQYACGMDMGNFATANKADFLHINPPPVSISRSEEHTSELQSREKIVCRLLLEKKKK